MFRAVEYNKAPMPYRFAYRAVVTSGGRHTPPGSIVSFVELSGNKGWIVESAKDGAVLEKSADGHFMVENITGA